jgi:BACON domain-containing protein/fibronectin type III domain protein
MPGALQGVRKATRNTRIEVYMHQGHQDLTLRRGVMGARSLRLCWGIGLALAVSIWTLPEAWALNVSPAAMSFQAVQGATNPPSQTVKVSKSNNRTTSWTATDNATWLTVSPGVGTITSTAQFTVGVNTTGLAAGTYTTTVMITVVKGGSTSVPVTLTVAPAATTSSLTTTTSTSTSTTASLTWAADTSTGLAGYKVYLGTASGVYGTSLNVGNVTSYVVSNLAVGTTYYFVVTAYNTSGSESPPSNEVSKSIY